MLLKQDQAANAAVELVRKGICNDWFTVQLKPCCKAQQAFHATNSNCFATGWHVPLSVALTQNMAVPTNGSSATVQAEASRELSILVAVTSTCCTQQVGNSCQASINTTSAQVNFSGVVQSKLDTLPLPQLQCMELTVILGWITLHHKVMSGNVGETAKTGNSTVMGQDNH